MNRNLQLIATIHLLIATTTCSAMEDKPKPLFELSTTPDENFAAFVSNNRFIINGENSCRVMDITTKEPMVIIKDTPFSSSIALHPNRESFALYNKKKIIIYDTKTGLEKWTPPFPIHNFQFCIFGPLDNTIFVCNDIFLSKYVSQHNYSTNKISIDNVCSSSRYNSPLMDIHPIKPQICAWNNEINFYDYDQQKNCYQETKKCYQETKPWGPDPFRIQYSPNGYLIAIADRNFINIVNNNDETMTLPVGNLRPTNPTKQFTSIEFHPNSAVIAALIYVQNYNEEIEFDGETEHPVMLRYLDNNKGHIITETPLTDFHPYHITICKRALSFSPDGTNIGIKLYDRFIILPVPFEVIYHPEAHEKIFLISEILKKYELQDIMLNFLEAFKR